MNNILCGKCAKKQGLSKEERIELAFQLQQGLNKCECGRVLELNRRLVVVEEGN